MGLKPPTALVSIVIPAYNAQTTLAHTLDSVLAQTLSSWEAIVIDDGSNDSTGAIAQGFAARDERIRMLSQGNRGEGEARNAGMAGARGEWLLFLDSDDWLLPRALEQLTGAAQADPSLEAVHCGWARASEIGGEWEPERCPASGDLFPLFATQCAFPVHACLIRRDRALEVGPFEALATCADWDFWQRFTRTSPRVGSVPAPLVRYLIRPMSRSSNAVQLLTDGLGVIATGHAADPRVARPSARYAPGAPAWELARTSLVFACWCAGMTLVQGGDAQALLHSVRQHREPLLGPAEVAEALFDGARRGAARPGRFWPEIWPLVEAHLPDFLKALESQAEVPGLAERVSQKLARRGLRDAAVTAPYAQGSNRIVPVEVTAPLPVVEAGPGCERLIVMALVEGRRLGTIELPVVDRLIPPWLLADALVAEFAWPLLGAFFARTLYPTLRVDRADGHVTVWRDDEQLGSVSEGPGQDEASLHDTVGWAVFLQELWGRPGWRAGRFYDPQALDETSARRRATEDWLVLEVSEELPDLRSAGRGVRLEVRVGGVPLVGLLAAGTRHVRAQELRVAITKRGGVELCRVAVREGIVGLPWASTDRLRPRLAAAAQRHPRAPMPAPPLSGVTLAPGATEAVARSLADTAGGRAVAARPFSVLGTSASRRARLPADAAADVLAASESPVLSGATGDTLAYVPDLLWERSNPGSGLFSPLERQPGLAERWRARLSRLRPSRKTLTTPKVYDRHAFESLYAARPDPWDYISAYEERKYEQTLGLLPAGTIDRALELACAEGRFTVQLAPRVGHLVAADIAEVALGRARIRCAGVDNVEFVRLDLFTDPLPPSLDLIVCSEVLYYVESRRALAVVGKKLRDSLRPGGHLILAHTNIVAEEEDNWGLDWAVVVGARGIGEELAQVPGLRFVEELRTPLYRIQCFRREAAIERARGAERVVCAEHAPPLPHLAQRFRRSGETTVDQPPVAARTDRLPVLMYHRVTPAGADTTRRYRVTPDAFEQQLRYLRDNGFGPVGLDECRTLVERRGPLAGRRVLVTFDDGFLDFRTHAWPLLKRYGVAALVFIVTERAGSANIWDTRFGETAPLLSWEDMRALEEEGVLFGSHAATHRPLTALSPVEITGELARSKAALQRALQRPVDAIAYPHGDTDPAVEHLAGAVGYTYGFTTRSGLCGPGDSLLSMPRIEVSGLDDFETFVARLR
jgi:peptidoglycan/xylan/chitin deacetylase (PgdA/CDA1 family)/SAM-dependent methyltransferase